jgi:VanZ family protein
MRYSRWAVTLAYAGAVLYISTRQVSGPPLFTHADKVAHFFLYGGLGFLLAWSITATTRMGVWSVAAVAACLAAAYGALNEYIQQFVPTRSMDFWDGAANAVGAAIGALAAICRRIPARGGDEGSGEE